MQATGRNAPCPCGSGKKYKQCCIPNSLGFHRSTVAREHFNRAVSLHGKGHFAEAIKLYEAALAADLTLAQAHANLGSAFSSLARFEDAIQSYSNAIALAPESAILWSNLGLAQQQIARYQEAENSLRTVGLPRYSGQIRWHDHAWRAKRWHETEDISRTSSSARR
ncbi:tetratricopeptide repeat protein [Pigmentiphaga sp. NML030171]|uniref:tetratricopeptide repeat protein n=1 Tax=Pigmentiphaga sp. NML030171 TaxID=2008676 RepID=UPI0034E8697E